MLGQLRLLLRLPISSKQEQGPVTSRSELLLLEASTQPWREEEAVQADMALCKVASVW